MPVSSHPNLTKPHYTSNWSNTCFKEQKYNNKHSSSLSVVQQRINAINNNINSNTNNNHNMSNQFTMQDESPTGGYGPPAISHAPSGGSSLAYSMDTDAMEQLSSNASSPKQQQHSNPQLLPPSNNPSTSVGGGEMSAEQYEEYYNNATSSSSHMTNQYNQYQEEVVLQTQEGEDDRSYYDATTTVHDMHRKLLHVLSTPTLFSDAMVWQMKVDRGLDPSKPNYDDDNNIEGGETDGIKSFENEFEEEQSSRYTTPGAPEEKDDVGTEDGTQQQSTNDAEGEEGAKNKYYRDQNKLIPPLPLQIFASDAEVVLPQALTASQLFGIERVTGIELEAAAGIIGLSQLFLRWLALMPEGDHMNIIDPPGLTVMRISGGRYRVTGAHRVVWRWMNKFSPASTFAVPSDVNKVTESSMEEDMATGSGSNDKPDTDFDFGDLVTMTIIDVFETDSDGRLLSYCPTFDNRAVHKTPEMVERVRKGASHLMERMEVVARSPAGKSVNKVSFYTCLHLYMFEVSIIIISCGGISVMNVASKSLIHLLCTALL